MTARATEPLHPEDTTKNVQQPANSSRMRVDAKGAHENGTDWTGFIRLRAPATAGAARRR
eukprot:3079154-Prymnesium_polylepis.1